MKVKWGSPAYCVCEAGAGANTPKMWLNETGPLSVTRRTPRGGPAGYRTRPSLPAEERVREVHLTEQHSHQSLRLEESPEKKV